MDIQEIHLECVINYESEIHTDLIEKELKGERPEHVIAFFPGGFAKFSLFEGIYKLHSPDNPPTVEITPSSEYSRKNTKKYFYYKEGILFRDKEKPAIKIYSDVGRARVYYRNGDLRKGSEPCYTSITYIDRDSFTTDDHYQYETETPGCITYTRLLTTPLKSIYKLARVIDDDGRQISVDFDEEGNILDPRIKCLFYGGISVKQASHK